MIFDYFRDPLFEIRTGLNYLIAIFVLQMGLLFVNQWIIGRRKQAPNNIILSYGLYYTFFSIGLFINALINFLPSYEPHFDSFFMLAVFLRTIGGIIFSINIEVNIQEILKTRYLFSVFLIFFSLTIYFLVDNPFFYQILDFFNLIFISLPFIFTYYFMRNTFGEVRKRLKVSIIGMIFFFVGLIFSTKRRIEMIENQLSYASPILIVFKIITLIGILLFTYGFLGYSFSLELQWQKNLISIYIIDKKNNVCLYHKDYLESEIKSKEIFAGGIAGIVKTITKFTDSNKNLDLIHIEDFTVLLEFGKSVIAAMIIKKNLLNARNVLREIMRNFEFYFWNYLENKEILSDEAEIFKPMEIITRNLIKI